MIDFYNKSLKILEIEEEYSNITPTLIKKQYHKLALLYHPDKNNNSTESNKKFKDIKEAYDNLLQIIEHELESIDSDDSIQFNNLSDHFDSEITLYATILHIFINTVFNNPQRDNTAIFQIIYEIVVNIKKISLALFEQLDKETLIDIYIFLDKYRIILHIKDSILDEIKIIIEEKYATIEIYKLNPSVNDLLNNHFYKLYLDNQLYLVPLWKRENYFDIHSTENNENNEIIVICEPEIPDNMKIDYKSNIHTQYEICVSNLKELIEAEVICIPIGDIFFQIPVEKLCIKKEQLYVFQEKGLTKDHSDYDDIHEKADIIVKIVMVFE